MTQVLEALKWRYATKKFNPNNKLSFEKINTLKKAFNLTATSFGLQPVRLVVLNDKTIQEKLVAASMGQRQVADASHLLILCIEKNVGKVYVENYFDRVKDIRSTPEEVLKPFKNYLLDHFTTTSEQEKQLWAAKQAYLVMGNLLTVCALEGIDACPMEGFVPSEYNDILGLAEKGIEAVLVLPVGYRAEDDMFSDFKKVRKPLENSVIDM
ncbi:NAD(P)H-dependent oxidoreductase [Dokdonia sp. Hel_I_53]|uniref:NAD(P)H-dependent oxidoreductase n=1 Tax=Dokdonia sp. Hel_I_53 TaxID=1566287 RepID=UPI00119C808D|nr:NAD(P)H-dependent oxidoreductase [Dokdonia sp. Hel_I_53]TVZ51014.1 nitroreductase [Dokdonia sp. Hel_I_53]